MLARWRWVLHQLTKRLWFRASLFSLLGIATALLAVVFKDYIPESLPARIGADAVDKILGIIASSMLAVTTFSLSTMVTAYGAASSEQRRDTPRHYTGDERHHDTKCPGHLYWLIPVQPGGDHCAEYRRLRYTREGFAIRGNHCRGHSDRLHAAALDRSFVQAWAGGRNY